MNKPFDPTKPVQTRDGKPARIIATNRRSQGGSYPIIALITHSTGSEEIALFTEQGLYNYGGLPSSTDLINVPEKRTYERWVNVYADGSAGGPHLDRQSADSAGAHTGRVACIHIKREYVEGEGL